MAFDWKLTPEEQEMAIYTEQAMRAAMVTLAFVAYVGRLDGKRVVIFGWQGPDSTMPLMVMMNRDLFDTIEVERDDDSVRAGD